ncbi:MAG: helix-turn-helix transcriptional regulator [Oscillospiraceae bacterium]|nr:helix-turn-helix transcriptional regulator [Oscillospiraceae bacterium]
MNSSDNAAIGLRIRTLRKRKGYNQQELADILGKSLRTVQKYESGEIEVSIAVANQLAKVLDTTPTFLFGYETEITPIRSLADVVNFLFHIEQVNGLDFSIDVKRPPRSKEWQCSITFNGKADADFNADLCLFLEDWEGQRDNLRTYGTTQEQYREWKTKTLAYYASSAVECSEPEELDPDERLKRRIAYLNSLKPQNGEG